MMKSSLLLWVSLFSATAAMAAPHGILYTKQQMELNRILKGTSSLAAPKLQYYGGPIISHVKAHVVFWGTGVDATTVSKIGDFMTSTVNSTYMDWLKEYNTNLPAVDHRPGTNQTIGRGSAGGIFVITPGHTGHSLQDADVRAEIEAQVAAGVLPKPTDDSIFMIYFPPGISITIEGQSSCSAFCAYHEGFKSTSLGNTFYGVMPDLGGMCSFGCGFADSRFDSLTAISSHELIEAVTDPFPTPGDKPAFPQAWNTTDGQEIGDLCASTSSRLTTQGLTYTLQGEFDNTANACQTGTYQSP